MKEQRPADDTHGLDRRSVTATRDRHRARALFALLCAGMGLLAAPGAQAQQSMGPDLLLYPARIVFERSQRTAQLDLVNNLNGTATYRIRFVNRRMSETGEMIELTGPGPGERFADGMLRYSPRQVMLAPGAAQTIRILLRKPAELAPGEYRSHLLFERIPDAPERPPPAGRGAERSEGIEIQLQPLVSVSIPVIVRHGETRAQVAAANLALQKARTGEPPVLSFELRRSGNRSAFGDLEATFDAGNGQRFVVGGAKGVAVYVPNPLRRVRLALTPPPGVALARGRLELVYRERPEDGGATIARAELPIP